MNIIRNILGLTCYAGATVLVCLFVAYTFYPAQFGRARANLDLIRNHYEIRYYGLTFTDDIYYLYFKNLGIRYSRVAGCAVNTSIIESTRSYNETMRDAILRDKGIDVDEILEFYITFDGADNEE